MVRKYPHLLSPFRIGDVILRNRMTASASRPHFIQGPEPYPTEATIIHYANKAKGGAAVVTCGCGFIHGPPKSIRGLTKNTMVGHYERFDIDDTLVQHPLSHLAEAIHFYGAKAFLQIGPRVPEGYDVSTDIPPVRVMGDEGAAGFQGSGLEAPVEVLDKVAEDMVLQALIAKSCGFDGVYIHMAYRASFLGRFLSPLTNRRKDRYGGSLENRVRFPLMICKRIKEACGADFLIEVSITGHDPTPGGWTLKDTVEFARMAEGRIDMLQLRSWDIELQHPTGFDLEPAPFASIGKAVKESGAKVAVVAIGGFTHPDICEETIASGKADLIAMARAWISNPDFGLKVYEGRVDEIVPCIRCNRCHRSSWSDPWISVCSVNPTWGMEHLIDRLVKSPTTKRKVAVIGGGPAGMKAAITCVERGHEVTLFEKSDSLGGLLKISDHVSFKWPLRDFKNYLIRQVEKLGVEVHLKTEATPERLINGGYDVLIIAVGSEPIIPPIQGINRSNVVYAVDVYGKENSLGEEIVIVGGGETGVETAMHLVEKGHKVTVIEMRDKLAPEAVPIHYRSVLLMTFEKMCQSTKRLSYMLGTKCIRITDDGITCVNRDGETLDIKADNVVIAAGMKPRIDKALELARTGIRSYLVGDCNYKVGNVQKAIRSAFAAACAI